MTDHLIRRVVLTAEKIGSRESMASFMKEALQLPDYFGGNLDALHDCLSEVNADTVIQLDEETLRTVCDEKYAWKVMRVLLDETEDNPHIRVKLL